VEEAPFIRPQPTLAMRCGAALERLRESRLQPGKEKRRWLAMAGSIGRSPAPWP